MDSKSYRKPKRWRWLPVKTPWEEELKEVLEAVWDVKAAAGALQAGAKACRRTRVGASKAKADMTGNASVGLGNS